MAIEHNNKSANRLWQFLIDAGVADIVHAIRFLSADGIFHRFIFDSLRQALAYGQSETVRTATIGYAGSESIATECQPNNHTKRTKEWTRAGGPCLLHNE